MCLWNCIEEKKKTWSLPWAWGGFAWLGLRCALPRGNRALGAGFHLKLFGSRWVDARTLSLTWRQDREDKFVWNGITKREDLRVESYLWRSCIYLRMYTILWTYEHLCGLSEKSPCSSLLAAARSVFEVEAESKDGVPGRLPVLELPAEPRPPARLGGVRFFWDRKEKTIIDENANKEWKIPI